MNIENREQELSDYGEFQHETSRHLHNAIEALGPLMDHLSYGAPWRDELGTMIIRLAEMNRENGRAFSAPPLFICPVNKRSWFDTMSHDIVCAAH